MQSKIKDDLCINIAIGVGVPILYFSLVAGPLSTNVGPDALLIIPILIIVITFSYFIYKREEVLKWRRETFSLRKRAIAERLKEPGWVLVFNRKHPKGFKNIEFLDDGKVGEGQNDNEYSWEINRNSFIIYKSNGVLQNKFYYGEKTNRFISTNDSTAAAIRRGTSDQYLYRQ